MVTKTETNKQRERERERERDASSPDSTVCFSRSNNVAGHREQGTGYFEGTVQA